MDDDKSYEEEEREEALEKVNNLLECVTHAIKIIRKILEIDIKEKEDD